MTEEWDVDLYGDSHSYVYEYGEGVVDVLAPEADERVLDVGCGKGDLTAYIATEAAELVGVDAAEEMVEEARRQHPELEFHVADARLLDDVFDGCFDGAFSNAALHWIPEAREVAEAVYDVLDDGGRFVAEMGGEGNVASVVTALEDELEDRGFGYTNPWYFPSMATQAGVLEDAGFEVTYAALFDRPTEVQGEDGLRDWMEMYCGSFFEEVPEDEVEDVEAAVEQRLRGELYDWDEGCWTVDYRRLRFEAYRR